jgi:fatty-acyl-CoA synthase
MDTSLPSTIGATLDEAAVRRGSASACIDGEHAYSYADIEASAQHVACGLLALGLKCGDRIGIAALNQIEWLQIFYGAAQIGVTVVGMSLRYRDSELEYMVADSQLKFVFTLSSHADFDFFAMWARLGPRLPMLQGVIGIDRRSSASTSCLADLLATPLAPQDLAQARAEVLATDLAMVIYTSGTTGRPKGAGLTHHSMLASARAQAAHMRLDQHDRLTLPMPLNHVGGITCGILSMLIGGGCIDLIAEFKASLVLDRMALHAPTLVGGVPTMMTLLLMDTQERAIAWQGVRLVYVGGSNVDATLLAQLQTRMPKAALMNLYGLSESSGALVMTPWDCTTDDLMNSIGKPIGDGEVRVLAADGSVLPGGEVGELCYRGAGVIAGFVGSAAAKPALDNEGWLHSGDLGMVDSRGVITLKGRSRDMFIQGGFNVYPVEVETFIARHPKVMMVAGIGVPDPMMGEIGRYYIVAKPGSDLSAAEVTQYCREQLADYKVPRQIVLRDELPLTPAGKIHKAALRNEAG